MERDNVIHTQLYSSPCGKLLLGSFGSSLCLCDWISKPQQKLTDKKLEHILQAPMEEYPSEITIAAARQLDEYFSGKRQAFSLPLLFVGTDFQKEVWNALLSIPFGKTVSYGWLAHEIGRSKAVRAVGMANGANSISIFVPCHRIIGSGGKLVGYRGGLPAKHYLLELEGNQVKLG